MSKYIVETFYTCTFKIVHKLDELSEKKLSELEDRKDGEVQIIDVRLNNRKTKTTDRKDKSKHSQSNLNIKGASDISSLINEKIAGSDKTTIANNLENKNVNSFLYFIKYPLKILSFCKNKNVKFFYPSTIFIGKGNSHYVKIKEEAEKKNNQT